MNFEGRDQTIGYTTYRIAHAYMRVLDQRIRPLGIGASESFIILFLKHHGPGSLVEIARYLGHAHPSIIRHIDALEKAGIVERRPHETDRRVKVIHLTETGNDFIPRILKIYRETEEGAVCGLEGDVLETFVSAAHLINSNLSIMAGPDSEEEGQTSR